MYMYLSDRIRRMFLSGACPQNISPKKSLSLKDQRFLQKTKADKNLSKILLKQQKLLYEKHIGLLLQEKKKATANINLLRPSSFSEKMEKKADICNFRNNSQGLFVQNIKVQTEKQDGLFDTENKKKPINKAEKTSVFLEKSKILNIGKSSNQARQKTQARLSNGPTNIPFVYNISKAGSLFNNESSYKNFRYLYDHESLKTSIVPQIFKNQKPISRAKTLLQERKKIALIYGQLAKKDIINISKKALSIPGFFEDNMFTLLESRVDVCVFRAGFSKTIAGARQLIRNGSLLINGQKIYSCKRKAKPGDYFCLTNKQALLNPYRSTTLELYHLCLSSNFLKEWVSFNRIKFLWQFTFKHHFLLTEIESKKNEMLCNIPQWLLLLFFAIPSTEKKYKPSFCSSLYWGFFLYKLKKMPVFSCFFEQKKANKGFSTFEKNWFSGGTIRTSLNTDNQDKVGQLWHKGEELPLETLIVKKLGEDQLQEKKTRFEKKQNDKRFCSASIKKKGMVLLNLYTQLLLKKQKKVKMFSCSNKRSSGAPKQQHLFFRKKIGSSNLWAIWGQKPLHLEISHKTGGFIYMYKPQKMISPVRLDFKP